MGLTRDEAAEKFGIHPKSFRTIMCYGECDGKNLGKIAKGLDMKPWEVVA